MSSGRPGAHRPGRTGHLATLAVLLGTAGCGGAEVPSESPVGVNVLRQSIDATRMLPITEELRLGGDDDEATSFFRVLGAAQDTGGNLYVLEYGNYRVSVFDAGGALTHRFGRQGEGPGDFVGPFYLWLSGDTIAVGDRQNRLHFFRTDGTHLLTRIYAELGAEGDGWTTGAPSNSPAGWLLSTTSYFRRDESGSDANLKPMPRMKLMAVEEGGTLTDTGLLWGLESQGMWSGVYWLQAPAQHQPTWAVDGLGRFHVAETDDYSLDVYATDGTHIKRIENEAPRIRVDDDLLDLWRKSRCTSGPECDPRRDELALSLPGPESRPMVGRIYGFAEGHTAVRRADSDPDPYDRTAVGELDFFDPEGHFMGRVPSGRTPWWFDGRTLIVTERDEQGIEYVVRYRVEG